MLSCRGCRLSFSTYILQALKMFKEVEKHFADFDEDQFDFHSYCIRKMTLRAYVRLYCSSDEHRSYGNTSSCGVELLCLRQCMSISVLTNAAPQR